MKLLILGITGRTGQLVAEEAVRRGHKVVGIARDPGVEKTLFIKQKPAISNV